ncbi:MAG: hypothetical protein FRX49_05572 [Trebouxia sp. A1-2]|nr:MAG: hypothetical protein FRX49_05572 [Trebouxia sp. A1-2]
MAASVRGAGGTLDWGKEEPMTLMPMMSAPGMYGVASEMAAVSAMMNTIAMSPSRAANYATAECKMAVKEVEAEVRGGGGGLGKWAGPDQKLGVGQMGVGPAPSQEPHSPWRFGTVAWRQI